MKIIQVKEFQRGANVESRVNLEPVVVGDFQGFSYGMTATAILHGTGQLSVQITTSSTNSMHVLGG